jgi:hypothetical protein
MVNSVFNSYRYEDITSSPAPKATVDGPDALDGPRCALTCLRRVEQSLSQSPASLHCSAVMGCDHDRLRHRAAAAGCMIRLNDEGQD